MLNALRPAEIAHLLESLPLNPRKIAWQLVDESAEGEILLEMTDELRDSLIQEMATAELVAATEGLDSDDLADLLKELPRYITWQVLDFLDLQNRERLEGVLSYPEDSAGGMMNVDRVTVRTEVTLDVVMRYLRKLGTQVPRVTDKLFVVNRDGRYLGALSLPVVLTRDPNDTLAEVMSLDLQPIPADWNEREVANRFERHDLLSAPVVDSQGQLLGRITVDDVVDVIREEGEHQYMGKPALAKMRICSHRSS
ncbi:MAG: CBS domain-containing protein [Gammaproteobacteria bacterium]|nr:CBS domain-containing protein [Gammaproteobacteria bacterium]